MNIRNIVLARLEQAVAEHSPMPFPEEMDDDVEMDVETKGGVTRGGGPSVTPQCAKLRPRERNHVTTYHVTRGRVEHKLSSVYNGGWELA